ncbi:MAG: sigma-70 family RNA polymerase sigma factor [Gammaproteobacteria bacterium]|nr:sigma-70 family RNA polymerase sigma factor [Gammaproteobacteria bacterium]
MPLTDTGSAEEAGREREAPLIRGARAGDTKAFEQLYRLHVGRVYALCLRMTARTELAEDLTQDAFVKAWQSLDSFRGDSAFGTWLHRLAANVVIDHQRKQKSWFSRFSSTDDEDFVEPAAPRESHGLRRDLDSAIAQLPPGARTVFVLHDVAGWQHDEIAERTGTAVGTCKAQLHRARKLLQEWLS